MGVYQIRYCVTEKDTYAALQVVLGDAQNQLKLRKHGVPGNNAKCHAVTLEPEDYIREVHYTFNPW